MKSRCSSSLSAWYRVFSHQTLPRKSQGGMRNEVPPRRTETPWAIAASQALKATRARPDKFEPLRQSSGRATGRNHEEQGRDVEPQHEQSRQAGNRSRAASRPRGMKLTGTTIKVVTSIIRPALRPGRTRPALRTRRTSTCKPTPMSTCRPATTAEAPATDAPRPSN